MSRVVEMWWPLATSWLLMSAELPLISAVVARLSDPEVNLASYGSVVFPLALMIEAPVIMLLAASTALARDIASYTRLRKYMMASGLVLTVFHLAVALTPLFDLAVGSLIRAPAAVMEPSRIGLLIMTPWTWAIAYRRFNQGVLIRFGRARVVGAGTVVRLLADVTVLMSGLLLGSVSGVVVGTMAISVGVIVEAVFIGVAVRPLVRGPLVRATPPAEPLTFRSFTVFYLPLAATSFIMLAIQPMISAALSRMPRPLESLAAWPVVYGVIFVLRCLGHAYQEVVLALIEQPGAGVALKRFSALLSALTVGILLLVAATPLSVVWFQTISGLTAELGDLAAAALWFGLLLPAFSVLQNWLQAILVDRRQTRRITESVLVFLVVTSGALYLGVLWSVPPGLYVALTAFTIGGVVQISWLWFSTHRLT